MRGSLLLLPLALTAAGCRIARTSANDAVARLDTAWIVPGETTFREVVKRLGLPPPVGKADDVPAYISADSLHYIALDTRSYRLDFGYIVTPTFEYTRTRLSHDILIRFDAEGRVTHLSRVRDLGEGCEVLEYREIAR